MSESQIKSYRVLVVDDEPSVRKAYQMMLKHLGHPTATAEDGANALALLAAGQFDLIITDYLMPGMKGDELIAEIKRRQPGQRILMVTAFGEYVLASGKTIGADCILNKPFRIEEIRAAIEQVMACHVGDG
jgi:two-component system response regulator PilR (NtrC family)